MTRDTTKFLSLLLDIVVVIVFYDTIGYHQHDVDADDVVDDDDEICGVFNYGQRLCRINYT